MILDFFTGFSILIGYFIIAVLIMAFIRRFVKMPKELFRKGLHMIVLFASLIWIYAFETWWVSMIAAIVFAALVFPVLTICERFKWYAKFLIQRKNGEIKRSLIAVSGMYAVLIGVCWGWLNDKLLVIACVFAWGLGDAAAALIGKRFGKRYLQGKLIQGRKSVEGTMAMLAFSFAAVITVLLIHGGLYWYAYVPIAAIAAAASAVVELYTLNGYDTITCPFAAAAVIIPLVHFCGKA